MICIRRRLPAGLHASQTDDFQPLHHTKTASESKNVFLLQLNDLRLTMELRRPRYRRVRYIASRNPSPGFPQQRRSEPGQHLRERGGRCVPLTLPPTATNHSPKAQHRQWPHLRRIDLSSRTAPVNRGFHVVPRVIHRARISMPRKHEPSQPQDLSDKRKRVVIGISVNCHR